MKQYIITSCVLTALMLGNTAVKAEDQYPASDFKPKVVYQDESAAKETSAAPSKSSSSSVSSSSSSDAQYPATNFQPKVVYSDENYKHSDIAPKPYSSASKNSVSSSDSSAAPASVEPMASAQKEDSSLTSLLGLLVVGGAGFFMYKKGFFKSSASTPARGSVDYTKNANGLTGVARYVLKASGTGVSRYIDKQVKSAPAAASGATGVAKYLASQSDKPSSASKAATGVEKYLKNKG